MFQYNTTVFEIDFQEVLELLGVTRGSISITLGLQIFVYQKLFIIMLLMRIYNIFHTKMVSLPIWKTNARFKKYLYS